MLPAAPPGDGALALSVQAAETSTAFPVRGIAAPSAPTPYKGPSGTGTEFKPGPQPPTTDTILQPALCSQQGSHPQPGRHHAQGPDHPERPDSQTRISGGGLNLSFLTPLARHPLAPLPGGSRSPHLPRPCPLRSGLPHAHGWDCAAQGQPQPLRPGQHLPSTASMSQQAGRKSRGREADPTPVFFFSSAWLRRFIGGA